LIRVAGQLGKRSPASSTLANWVYRLRKLPLCQANAADLIFGGKPLRSMRCQIFLQEILGLDRWSSLQFFYADFHAGITTLTRSHAD
jgi:hypothetical protein